MKTQTFKLLASLLLPLTFLGCGTRPLYVAMGYDPRIGIPRFNPVPHAALIWLDGSANPPALQGSVVDLAGVNPALGARVPIAGPGDLSGPLITPVGADKYFVVWQDGDQLWGKLILDATLADAPGAAATLLTPGEKLAGKHNYDLGYDPSSGRLCVVYVAGGGGAAFGLRSHLVRLDQFPRIPALTPEAARPVASGLITQPKISMPITGWSTALGISYLVAWVEHRSVGAGTEPSAAPIYGNRTDSPRGAYLGPETDGGTIYGNRMWHDGTVFPESRFQVSNCVQL